MRKGKKKQTMIPKNFQFIDSAFLNDATFNDYQQRLKRLATSIFEWENLPNTMNERYIEETLFYNGACAFLYDKDWLYINTKASMNGDINIYGLPTKINCYSYTYNKNRIVYNGLVKPDKDKACIYVLNNNDRIPTCESLTLFAYRLAECQRSIDSNIQAQKFPYVGIGSQEQVLSFKNLFLQVSGNQPLIIADNSSINLDNFKILPTNVPFVADKLTKEKKEIWNEALTFLGINNIETEKKERRITGEIDANNECINLNLQAFLIPRQLACKQFNDLMGFTGTDKEIKVKLRSDLKNIIKQAIGSDSAYFDMLPDKEVIENE